MDQEIEVKFLLSDLVGLNRKIGALGLTCIQERVHELNLRFDFPDGSLVEKKEVLRLRLDEHAKLAFKGPEVLEDGVLVRKEIEVEVSNFEAGKRLLEALGYQIVMIYEKFRTNYQLHDLTLSVDEMPFGFFVELEGKSAGDVHAAAEILGFDWDKRINTSYSALLRIYNQNTGQNFRDLSFENFKGLVVKPDELGLSLADLEV
jgi:adenylate cyclase class 2